MEIEKSPRTSSWLLPGVVGVLAGGMLGCLISGAANSGPTSADETRPAEARRVPATSRETSPVHSDPAKDSDANAPDRFRGELPGLLTQAAGSEKAVAEQFQVALRNADPLKRMHQLLALLDLIQPENAGLYYKGWVDYLRRNRVDLGLEALINRRLGQTGGAKFVGSRKGEGADMAGTGTYVRDQFLGWMDRDPGAARKWLDGLQNEKFREAMIGGYLQYEAGRNRASIVAVLQSIPEDLQIQYGGEIVQSLRAGNSGKEINDWITAMAAEGEANTKSAWLKAVMDGFMQQETSVKGGGATPAEFYEAHAGQPYLSPDWGAKAAARYASENPTAALDWAFRISGRPEFNGNQELMTAAVSKVHHDRLVDAVTQCAAFSASRHRDAALAALAVRLVEAQQPEQAARAAASIADPALRPNLPVK